MLYSTPPLPLVQFVSEPHCYKQKGVEIIGTSFEFNGEVIADICPSNPLVIYVRKDATASQLASMLVAYGGLTEKCDLNSDFAKGLMKKLIRPAQNSSTVCAVEYFDANNNTDKNELSDPISTTINFSNATISGLEISGSQNRDALR